MWLVLFYGGNSLESFLALTTPVQCFFDSDRFFPAIVVNPSVPGHSFTQKKVSVFTFIFVHCFFLVRCFLRYPTNAFWLVYLL